MCQPQRTQANYSQVHHLPPQSSVGRHPSREQLIDYLMLKVAHQPTYTQSQCSPRQSHELVKQEVRVKCHLDDWHLSVIKRNVVDFFLTDSSKNLCLHFFSEVEIHFFTMFIRH